MGFWAHGCQQHLPLQSPLSPASAYRSPDTKHLTLNLPAMLPPTTGPLHTQPRLLRWWFPSLPYPLTFQLTSLRPQKSLTSLTSTPSMSSTTWSSHRFSSIIIWWTAASITGVWVVFWQKACQILLSMGPAAAVTGTGLVWCRHSINVC